MKLGEKKVEDRIDQGEGREQKTRQKRSTTEEKPSNDEHAGTTGK